jgi:hypothetical protein
MVMKDWFGCREQQGLNKIKMEAFETVQSRLKENSDEFPLLALEGSPLTQSEHQDKPV